MSDDTSTIRGHDRAGPAAAAAPGDRLHVAGRWARVPIMETTGYGFVTPLQSRGDLSAVDDVLFERGVLSPAAHMAWTGLTAVALWRAATHRWRTRAVGGFLAVYAVAVALHTAWDSSGRTAAYVVLAVLSLGLLTGAAHQLEEFPPAVRVGRAVR